MEYEAMLFGLSVGMGAALYLCYELLAALRKVFFRHKAVWNALDVFYWIGAGFFVFCMVYRFNQGILRSFLFLGNFLGAWICSRTAGRLLGRLIGRLLEICVFHIKNMTKRLLFFLGRCNILMYSLRILHKKQFFGNKRVRQVEKVKKKKDKKENKE